MNSKTPFFKQNRSLILLVIGTLIIILFSLYLFTKPAIWNFWDLSDKGQIGDTIGGIASPIIALLGAVLVFLSFNEQIEANRIQRKALSGEIIRSNSTKDLNLVMDLFRQVREDYDSLSYKGGKGKQAIIKFRDMLFTPVSGGHFGRFSQ
jgi:hypothetical protein